MLKMKKILGIFLAVCFVLSVTAAATSAAPYTDGRKQGNHGKNTFNNYDKKKFDNNRNKWDADKKNMTAKE